MIPTNLVQNASLSKCWLDVADRLLDMKTALPFVMECKNVGAAELDQQTVFERDLDNFLMQNGKVSTRETANTIFPSGTWRRNRDLAVSEFCEYCCDKLYPRMKARSVLNRRGTYFLRMMEVPQGRSNSQLDAVITAMQKTSKRPRESMCQIAIYDPSRDLTNLPRQGFPCLQQYLCHMAVRNVSHSMRSICAVAC